MLRAPQALREQYLHVVQHSSVAYAINPVSSHHESPAICIAGSHRGNGMQLQRRNYTMLYVIGDFIMHRASGHCTSHSSLLSQARVTGTAELCTLLAHRTL